MDFRSFFYALNHEGAGLRRAFPQGKGRYRYRIWVYTEVEEMRTRITLACTECKQRNYNTTKDKKAHPDRMETMKYCRFCRKHTTHKETK